MNGKTMKITKLKNLTSEAKLRILNRSKNKDPKVREIVSLILADVRLNQDVAIKKYIEKFNGIRINDLKVSSAEITEAYTKVSKDFQDALEQSINNISKVAKSDLDALDKKVVSTEKGIKVWRKWRPIDKVGLYIPGGKAVYPSSVLMTGILAKIAGCRDIILCTPPNLDGKIAYPTLVAANIIGIKNIFKVGGAEAIGAMAYGTNSIPKVYKIFGAGNAFVTEAKMQVFGDVDIDMPAGPSEVFIIADESANPSFIAADLLADGEHGFDSACVLLTTSYELAEKVSLEIEKQLKSLTTAERIKQSLNKYGLLALVDSISEAIEFANDYAPEHLEIMTKNADKLVSKITNAGSIFLGNWTAKSAGDYATGGNHIIPTAGYAKMFSPLSIESFGRQMQVQKIVSKAALAKIRKTVEVFGEIEKLPAHKNSMSIRFKENYED